MELKLFGKNVFEFKSSKSSQYFATSSERLEKSEFLPDFNTMQVHDNLRDFLEMESPTSIVQGEIVRMENRKKYSSVKDFFEEYPYTNSSRIAELVKKHDHLKLGKVEQFLADMPKEAVKAMKDYTAKTKELCGKKAIFYIIANKEDFKKTEKRKDPILLAQSPFGHFWQILGAWDE
jgi:hypothetical protein